MANDLHNALSGLVAAINWRAAVGCDASADEDKRSFADQQVWNAVDVGNLALTSPVAPEQVVAAGWKLVPVEPTRDMRDAAKAWTDAPTSVYRAMLAASPEAAPAAMEGCQRPNVACAAPECGADCRFSPAATPAAPSAVADLAHELYAMAQGPRPIEDAVEAIATRLCSAAATPTPASTELRHALMWTAAALQALIASRGESGSINMIVSGEKKSLEDVLDLADAALAQPAPVQAGAQQAVAYLMTRPSGFAWPLMPKDMTPEWREVCAAERTTIEPLYRAAPTQARAGDAKGGA